MQSLVWMAVGEVLVVVTWLLAVLLRWGFVGRLPMRYKLYYLFGQMFWVAAFFSAVRADYRPHAALSLGAFVMTTFFFMRIERSMSGDKRR